MADAKSTPSYSLDLHLLVIKNRPNRGPLICLIFRTYFTPSMLQISDFGRSDRKYHYRSDNCIIRQRKCRSERVLLASAFFFNLYLFGPLHSIMNSVKEKTSNTCNCLTRHGLKPLRLPVPLTVNYQAHKTYLQL